MRYFFYGLLIILLILTIFKDRKIRKDELCKEALFYQMLFNQCTPRDQLYDEELQKDT